MPARRGLRALVRWFGLLAAAVPLAFVLSGCPMNSGDSHDDARPTRSLDDVQLAHADSLMAIPGVVGVYQGALDDGTPFLGVMVKEKNAELERRIPKRLEGYRVKIDVTGEIRPATPGGK